MRLILTDPPEVEPITLDEAKNFLKVENKDDDALIMRLIRAARRAVEGGTRRALITQSWAMTLDEAELEIEIPRPPLQAVDKIEIIPSGKTEAEEIDTELYDVELAQDSPGRVKLRAGKSWPAHRNFASFIVSFTAGHGDAGADVPEDLIQAILIILGKYYDDREGGGEIPQAAKDFMQPYKVYWL